MRAWLCIMCLSLLSGCASVHYAQTQPGVLKGRLLVEWIGKDQFIFRPDTNDPLTFTRHNHQTITPGVMYTDGGSIPRPLWALQSFSPWGYAPAFIVHDWLFVMKHCGLPGSEQLSLDEAARIMSEVMRTMMEKYGSDAFTLYAMYEAVRSPIAKGWWEHGTCEMPAKSLLKRKPLLQYEISYP